MTHIWKMRVLHIIGICAALMLIVLVFAISCTRYDNSNPYDPDYTGAYSLSVRADTTVAFLTFTPYTFAYETGRDDFSSLCVTSEPQHMVDSSLFRARLSDDSLTLYFIDTGWVWVSVRGKRPNGLENSDSLRLHILNGFRIQGDTVAAVGDSLFYEVEYIDGRSWGVTVPRVIWTLNDSVYDTAYANEQCHVRAATRGIAKIGATVVDWLGNTLPLAPLDLMVPGSRPVIISAGFDTCCYNPGDTVVLTIQVADADNDTATVAVHSRSLPWRDSAVVYAPSTGTSIVFSEMFTDTGAIDMVVSVAGRDGLGSNLLYMAPAQVIANPPVVCFAPGTSTLVPVGSPHTFAVSGDPAEYYVWTIGDSLDTTSTASISKVFFDDVGQTMELLVFGIDTYGYEGSACSLAISAEEFLYTLVFDTTPDSVVVNDSAVWSVVGGSAQNVAANNPVYHWMIRTAEGDTLMADSARGKRSFVAVFDDSVAGEVNAWLIDSMQNRSPIVSLPFSVLLHKPHIALDLSSDTTGTCDAVFASLSSRDVNGYVAYTRFVVPGIMDLSFDSASVDSIAVVFPDSGTFSVKAWAVDDDSLCSDTAAATVRVLEYRPRVVTVDNNPNQVYRNDWVILCADIEQSQSRSPVVRTLWDFDADTSAWDIDTAGLCTRLLAADTGTQHYDVVCVDSAGRRSFPYSGSFRALDDRPVIVSLVPLTVWFNDDTTFSVYATDPNGQVTQVTVDWGDGTTWSTAAPASGLAQFNHRYAAPGNYTVTVTAVDDRSVSGSRTFSLLARKGQPHIQPVGNFSGGALTVDVDTTRYSSMCTYYHFEGFLKYECGDSNGTIQKVILSLNDNVDTVSYVSRNDSLFYDQRVFTSWVSWQEQSQIYDSLYFYGYNPVNEEHCISQLTDNTENIMNMMDCGQAKRAALYVFDEDGTMAADTFWVQINCTR